MAANALVRGRPVCRLVREEAEPRHRAGVRGSGPLESRGTDAACAGRARRGRLVDSSARDFSSSAAPRRRALDGRYAGGAGSEDRCDDGDEQEGCSATHGLPRGSAPAVAPGIPRKGDRIGPRLAPGAEVDHDEGHVAAAVHAGCVLDEDGRHAHVPPACGREGLLDAERSRARRQTTWRAEATPCCQ